jgi:hypothetical protein
MANKFFSRQPDSERGQSIVLIAAAMIGLLAFVGIAVDVGFVFARNSQLQAGVDSAALAGVTELSSGNINNADDRAERFLSSNNIPISGTATMESVTYQTILQETAYSLTVTWPVELFFLRVVGWDEVTLQKSATAAFFPLTDIYAGSRVDQGKLSTSNQAVFGPSACTSYGDPYSPFSSTFRPQGYPAGTYTYRYRILVPSDYPDNILRVELFDPDSYNSPTNDATIVHTNYATSSGFPFVENKSCTSARQDACLLITGEESLVSNTPPDIISIDQINPYWFMRIDENRKPQANTCGTPGSYTESFNTETLYQLLYYTQNSDGTIQEVSLASYTGLKTNAHNTDLRWVSPGGAPSFDGVAVPVNAGSPKTFELNLNTDVPNILVEQGTGNRYIYLNVTTTNGSSENGYEVWAGPNNYIGSVPSDGNERNIHVLDSPGAHNSAGAIVFAIGTLPLNSNTNNRVDVPLVYISPNFAGQPIFIRLFDADTDTQPPITFFFDSIAYNPELDEGDWFMTFGTGTDADGEPSSSRCFPNCDNQWLNPPYQIIVPGDQEGCEPNCTPFYGGRLIASYDGGASDTYVWEISIAGPPYLTR